MDEIIKEGEPIKKKAMPKWLRFGLLVVGLVLIIVGLFQIFGSDGKSSTFVNKFNELQAPGVGARDDLTIVGNLLNGIGAKETKKDYAGIISDLQTALAKLNDAAAKVESTSGSLTGFQGMLDASSDQNVKETGARFVDAFKARNAAALKMVNDAKDLVNQAITYYNEVISNQKITIDLDKFNAAANAFAANAQSLTTIGTQYDTAASDFAKAAGFTITKK
ncbi:MAG TPA: hypothetical protein P5524_02750 [Candidatus Paceibacterota bacterium]|nr:hypothetical protein [Candidatus Paceibacterota bacterium]